MAWFLVLFASGDSLQDPMRFFQHAAENLGRLIYSGVGDHVGIYYMDMGWGPKRRSVPASR
jgi:hypothetical protein